VNRAPRTGPRLVAERKRKRERERERERKETAGASKKRRRRHNRPTEASEDAEDAEDAAAQQLIAEQAAAGRSTAADADAISDRDKDVSDLILQYNTVRSYISAINKLWEHQTAHKLHSAPRPYRVAIKGRSSLLPSLRYGDLYTH
jgi:predicted lipid-binding transport protein (Tim44 family)